MKDFFQESKADESQELFMTKDTNFINLSYSRHAAHFNEYKSNQSKHQHAQNWLNQDTVDFWRHLRMCSLINPILDNHPDSAWLTIGDGRYGLDAQYISKKAANCLATDISDALLQEAFANKLINSYKVENAESLSFPDNSYDFIFCKESFHHFPRPILALYEMLRVSRKATILIEPRDPFAEFQIIQTLFYWLKSAIKFFIGKKNSKHNFEEVGNHIYTLSLPEIIKVSLSLNLKMIAHRGLNDFYHPDAIKEMFKQNGPTLRIIKLRILLADILCFLKLQPHQLISLILFKESIDPKTETALRKMNYQIIRLPRNPFISEEVEET